MCIVCEHPQRGEIDDAIRQGQTYSEIVVQFGSSITRISFHARNHLGLSRQTSCVICRHEQRIDIENRIRQGKSAAMIGREFDLHRSAANRHKLGCMGIAPTEKRASCKVCLSPYLETINQRIRQGDVQQSIVREYGISRSVIRLHTRGCLGIPANLDHAPGACGACDHDQHDAIDEMIRAGAKHRDIGAAFGLHHQTVGDHRRFHLGLPPIISPKGCRICNDPRRAAIEKSLIDAGVRETAVRFGFLKSMAREHLRRHLKPLLASERDAVMAEIMDAEQAQSRAQARLSRFLAQPGTEAGPLGVSVIESARAVLERRLREANKEVALADDFMRQARNRKRAAEVALQDLERADTELARRKVAREITERQHSAD